MITKNGSPVSGARVSASVGGLFDGSVTDEVRTDTQGRFMLQWRSNSDATKVHLFVQ
ncbi:MAG: DUF6795 domain-containing protein [Armatimonadota bacterium]